MSEPNLDKPTYTTKQILYGAFSRGALTGVTNKDPMINDWIQILDEHIANQVREARIEEAKLFNRYFDDNQAFKGFAEERLKELGE